MQKKTILTTWALALTLMATASVAATPVAAQTGAMNMAVDTVGQTQQDEVEAFSDTTQTDTTGVVAVQQVGVDADDDSIYDNDDARSLLRELATYFGRYGFDASLIFVLLVLLIVFVISPVAIIGLILYFVFRNRRQRMRLAEMAMKNGQPIPEAVRAQPQQLTDTADEVWQRGVRQSFFGIGLIVLLGYMIGRVGVGVGLLVLCIGLGNLIIARREQKRHDDNENINVL